MADVTLFISCLGTYMNDTVVLQSWQWYNTTRNMWLMEMEWNGDLQRWSKTAPSGTARQDTENWHRLSFASLQSCLTLAHGLAGSSLVLTHADTHAYPWGSAVCSFPAATLVGFTWHSVETKEVSTNYSPPTCMLLWIVPNLLCPYRHRSPTCGSFCSL